MEILISEYCPDRSRLQRVMDNNPRLARGGYDLASALGIRISHTKSDDALAFYTPSGLFSGTLTLNRGHNRRSGNPCEYFVFRSPTVKKEKCSARSNSNERDSEKITGIITAVKKNGETPTDDRLLDQFRPGINDAYNSITSSVRTPNVDLDSQEKIALLRSFIENNNAHAEVYRKEFEDSYTAYLDAQSKVNDALAVKARFKKGSHVVGIMSNGVDDKLHYILADLEPTEKNGISVVNVKRYETLSDTPIASQVMMIRTYTQSKSWYESSNELGMKYMDQYLDDIDVAVGYRNRENGLWVLIPKHGV